MAILADVAPYSREYHTFRQMVGKQAQGNTELEIEYEKILKRVKQTRSLRPAETKTLRARQTEAPSMIRPHAIMALSSGFRSKRSGYLVGNGIADHFTGMRTLSPSSGRKPRKILLKIGVGFGGGAIACCA